MKLKSYFQLEVSLENLCNRWSEIDYNFKKKYIVDKRIGIRTLDQDPVENLFTFICTKYGEKIELDDLEVDGIKEVYKFPKIAALAQDGVEARLKSLGFGYRAKYISQTAKYICSISNDPDSWLVDTLKYNRTKTGDILSGSADTHVKNNERYPSIKDELLKMTGVGPKVADCVCLMSMRVTQAIPVDTHVLQVARRDYADNSNFVNIIKSRVGSKKTSNRPKSSLPESTTVKMENCSGYDITVQEATELTKIIKSTSKNSKATVTKPIYEAIHKMFNVIFGEYSGWAQSILFVSDLPDSISSLGSNETGASDKPNDIIAGSGDAQPTIQPIIQPTPLSNTTEGRETRSKSKKIKLEE
ncbi:N-glycosylase/DNA lyase [Zancudomyces culisetae]|uniref:DNA-(apurinic or apyrimidinic site) lyase n=1 Tax=Zancudomyces culisetae TaxID=1213189 RepID=A0A1R1PCT6_ZANCU|nr:N-glycosylase/DNA lyase [Zancudomyces culisetae]|eukprot:OMH78751.1 N-glycosylase/DNA lyase [Zancudomyces culisetae]